MCLPFCSFQVELAFVDNSTADYTIFVEQYLSPCVSQLALRINQEVFDIKFAIFTMLIFLHLNHNHDSIFTTIMIAYLDSL